MSLNDDQEMLDSDPDDSLTPWDRQEREREEKDGPQSGPVIPFIIPMESRGTSVIKALDRIILPWFDNTSHLKEFLKSIYDEVSPMLHSATLREQLPIVCSEQRLRIPELVLVKTAQALAEEACVLITRKAISHVAAGLIKYATEFNYSADLQRPEMNADNLFLWIVNRVPIASYPGQQFPGLPFGPALSD